MGGHLGEGIKSKKDFTGQNIHKVSKGGARHVQIVQLERILLIDTEEPYNLDISCK